MLGKMKLPLWFGKFHMVYGGPYRQRPSGMRGVRVAREINRPAEVVVPIDDFSVPTIEEMNAGLAQAVEMILDWEPVYVGCMGGRGRTGLFLAVLAKAFGVNEPVRYVRANYNHHAVETAEQELFVDLYEVPKQVRRAILKAKFMSLLILRKDLVEPVYPDVEDLHWNRAGFRDNLD